MPQNFKNQLTSRNLKTQNCLLVWMYKEVIYIFSPDFSTFGSFVQAFGPQFSIFYFLELGYSNYNKGGKIMGIKMRKSPSQANFVRYIFYVLNFQNFGPF